MENLHLLMEIVMDLIIYKMLVKIVKNLFILYLMIKLLNIFLLFNYVNCFVCTSYLNKKCIISNIKMNNALLDHSELPIFSDIKVN